MNDGPTTTCLELLLGHLRLEGQALRRTFNSVWVSTYCCHSGLFCVLAEWMLKRRSFLAKTVDAYFAKGGFIARFFPVHQILLLNRQMVIRTDEYEELLEWLPPSPQTFSQCSANVYQPRRHTLIKLDTDSHLSKLCLICTWVRSTDFYKVLWEKNQTQRSVISLEAPLWMATARS